MKYISLIIMMLSLAGCIHETHCYNGVEYLEYSRGVTVAYNPDGTVKECKQ